MLHQAFTVYDNKVESYLRPFFCMTNGEAIRSFTDAVNDPTSAFHKHPADFTLFQIGVYDDTHGVLKASDPVNLGCAIEYKNGEN